MSLTDALKQRARELGFCAIGVTGAEPFREAETAAAGRTRKGLMDGLTWWSEARAHACAEPRRNTPDARSVIALAFPYPIPPVVPPPCALVGPGVLDNRRCIAFWTIEHRGSIPREMRPLIVDWIFGCDLCQEICPINAGARPSFPDAQPVEAIVPPIQARPRLEELLTLDEDAFRARFRESAVWRARRAGLLCPV